VLPGKSWKCPGSVTVELDDTEPDGVTEFPLNDELTEPAGVTDVPVNDELTEPAGVTDVPLNDAV